MLNFILVFTFYAVSVHDDKTCGNPKKPDKFLQFCYEFDEILPDMHSYNHTIVWLSFINYSDGVFEQNIHSDIVDNTSVCYQK